MLLMEGSRVNNDIIYLLEYIIDCFVPVSTNSPAFNNAGVVSKCKNLLLSSENAIKGEDEEFEANDFCPCDILFSIPCLLSS